MNLVNMLSPVTDVCDGLGPVLGIVGWVVLVVKIAVPIILIVIGMIDMTKAVLSKDEKEIKTAQGNLIKKAVAAVIVFLIITLVTLIFSTIMKQGDWKECSACVNDPTANETCEITTTIGK